MLDGEAADGSAALMYAALVVFVLSFAAVLVDMMTVTYADMRLATHADTVGRVALQRFDQGMYRQTGQIVVSEEVAQNAPEHAELPEDVTCTVEGGVATVTVTCTTDVDSRLLGRVFGTTRDVSRQVTATLVCTGCATQDVTDG